MGELRVLSYNVRSLRDDRAAVASVIRSCEPDVVAVQEAPRFLRWRSKRAALARESGLVVATADRPGGLMLMTTVAVTVRSTHFALLPKTPRLHQRAVCAAEIELRGEGWSIASVHFSMDAAERVRHMSEVWAAVDGLRPPLVIAGDINEPAGKPVWTELSSRLKDGYVAASGGAENIFGSARPRRQIDGIFVSPQVAVVECQAVAPPGADRASDHLPVLAVLRK